MDLAYGDVPPPLPVEEFRDPANDPELKTLVGRVNGLLEEAHCLQHSATAIIAHLQKNPDALAAVALTLAEISSVVAKMAPGALAALKGSAPAVFALLASPQFLIAAGVGLGITIVALGGYKIIKKIKAARDEQAQFEREVGLEEVDPYEDGSQLSHIEMWRRGIAEAEEDEVRPLPNFNNYRLDAPNTRDPAESSVDGEFITPEASAMKRVLKEEKKKRKAKSEKEKKKSKGGSIIGMLMKADKSLKDRGI
jgi:hypothetical protein